MRPAEILAALLLLAPLPAAARVLEVGPGRELAAPSAAARIAADGDTVRIDPGEYFDCAVWQANGLTIEGAGPDVVITDRACNGKAGFVLTGHDTTIRRLTFARMRVPDGNGAGIRAEGRSLAIEDSRFVNNQLAILAADDPASVITIRDSVFTGNGACGERGCVGAILVGQAARLDIAGSTLSATKGGHQISSAADTLAIARSTIEDGPEGTSSYLVLHTGSGTLAVSDSTLEKGPRTSNRRAAILIAGEGGAQTITGNRFVNDTGVAANFVVNWTGSRPTVARNSIAPGDTELTGAGRTRARLIRFAADTKAMLRHLAGAILRAARSVLHSIL